MQSTAWRLTLRCHLAGLAVGVVELVLQGIDAVDDVRGQELVRERLAVRSARMEVADLANVIAHAPVNIMHVIQ